MYETLCFFIIFLCIDPMTVEKMSSRFIHNVEVTADFLVSKAKQLIHNKTTKITENFMSIRHYLFHLQNN